MFFYLYKILYIDAEGENVALKIRRIEHTIQEEGCIPTTTYPSEISDMPWASNMQQCTLQRCQNLNSKLKRDLVSLNLPAKS